jgi:hypothetical protein
MLFILVMEPLQQLLNLATRDHLLTPINNRAAKIRLSMYADNATIFLNPVRDEVNTIEELLHIFGEASGLVINIAKCTVFPIRCEEIDLEEVMEGFACPIKGFPCTCLGLPLHFRALHRVEIRPIIDMMANRLPSWKGRFLTCAGRLKLVNSVLSSIPAYFLTVFHLKKWALKKLERFRECKWWPLSRSVGQGAKAKAFGWTRCAGPGAFWASFASEMDVVPMDGSGSTVGRH